MTGRVSAVEFCYGRVLFGDALSSRIGALSRDAHQWFGEDIPWETVSAPVTYQRRLLTFTRFELEIDPGRSNSVNPQIELSWSDDEGRTWSAPRARSMGAPGKYKTRLVWHNLGSSLSRIFRLRGSDPSPTALVSAWIDGDIGT